MRAVLAVDVLDDFLAPLVLEVDVDVGGLVALLADEALEQQRGLRRVHLGDAQAVADRRIGGRAATLAQDAPGTGERHHVEDGEEEGLVALLEDQRELAFDLLLHRVGHAAGIALARTVLGHAPQVAGRRLAGRHDLVRVLVLQLLQREVAGPCEVHAALQPLGTAELRQRQP